MLCRHKLKDILLSNLIAMTLRTPLFASSFRVSAWLWCSFSFHELHGTAWCNPRPTIASTWVQKCLLGSFFGETKVELIQIRSIGTIGWFQSDVVFPSQMGSQVTLPMKQHCGGLLLLL